MKAFAITPGDYGVACRQPAPEALRQAAVAFNAGRYFECHEVLEAYWLREPGAVRDLYKGVIQIAAGLYHWGNGNKRGCLKLLERGIVLVGRYGPRCQDLAVAELAAQAGEALAWARTAAPGTPMPSQCVPRITLAARA